MKVENRQKFLLILTGSVLALYVGMNFIYTPLSNWWSDRSAQIRKLKDQVADGNGMRFRDAAIRNQWSSMQTNALPAETSHAEQVLLKSVDDWARNCNVEVTSLMPQWKDDSTNYMTLNCRVEAAGTLDALTRFLYDLEQGPLAIRLDTVELGAHDSAGSQMTLSVDIDGLALGAQQASQ